MNLLADLSVLLQRRSIRVTLVAVFMAIPVVFILIATHIGPGISPDSTVYASTARSFAATGDLTNFYGKPLTMFPPGLPLVLGALIHLGFSISVASVLLGVVSAALTVLFTYLLARQSLSSIPVALVAAAMVAFSASLVRVDSMLWSEPMFAVVVLVVLWLVAKGINRGNLNTWLAALLGLLGAFAFSLRYIGIIVMIAAVIGVFIANLRVDRTTRIARTGLCLAVTLVGAGLIALRNIDLGVPPLGDRSPGNATLPNVLHDSAQTLGNYVIALGTLAPRYEVVAVILGIVVVAILAFGLVRAIRTRSTVVMYLGAFIALYWVLLAYSELTTDLDPLSERFTAPIFGPMVVLAIYAIDQMFVLLCVEMKRPSGLLVRSLFIAAIALLVVSFGTSSSQNIQWSSKVASAGIELNSHSNVTSPLAQGVAALPQGTVVATTNPWLTSLVSAHEPLRIIALGSSKQSAAQINEERSTFIQRVHDDNISYLAYYNGDLTQLTPDELHPLGLNITSVANFKDGQLFKVVR